MKSSILIVDDQKFICEGLERLLSDDYIIYKAFNGKEALDIIKQNSDIDVVLCDIMMPVMDGIELIEKVRSENKDIIIIVITAVYSGEKITNAMDKGANKCLMKPFDIPQLMQTLNKALANKK
ncbi:MAG: response regulator [Candidatus Hodarchaeales archaeon]